MARMADSDSDDEFRVGEDLVPAAEIKQAGTSELNFDGLLSTPLKLHEDLKEGCGGQLWPAGVALAKYVLREPRRSIVQGKQMFVSRAFASDRCRLSDVAFHLSELSLVLEVVSLVLL